MRRNDLRHSTIAILRALYAGPSLTAAEIAAAIGADVGPVMSALQRMRKRGLVRGEQPEGRRRYLGGIGYVRWSIVPGALERVTRQRQHVDPPLPPLPELADTRPRYQPSTVRVGGVEYQSYSGRMPLSAYAGASSLTGTARWGCA